MNLEGRIPFDNILYYQTRAPVFQKAFPVLPMATEKLRQRWLLWSQEDQGSQERFPQLRECTYSSSDRVTSSKSISKCTWIGRKRGRYLLYVHQGVFPSQCLGLCALKLQAAPNSVSQCLV